MNINKLQKENKKLHERVRELEAQLAELPGLKDIAAQYEIATTVLAHKIQVLDRVEKESYNRALMIKVLNEDGDKWREGVARLGREIEAKDEEIADLKAQVESSAPTIADLKALLDKVRDKMNRKEREAEAAILNRRALPKLLGR